MRFLRFGSLCLVAALALGACGDASVETRDAVVTISIPQAPSASLDPIRVVDVHSATVMAAIHAPLAYRNGEGDVVTVLADSIELSPDARSVRLSLTDARFWDGSPVTPDDVRFTFERLAKSGHPHADWMFHNIEGWGDFASGATEQLSGIKTTGERELELRLSEPDPEIVFLLCSSLTSVVKRSETVAKKPYDTHVVGAGAYAPEGELSPSHLRFSPNRGFPGYDSRVRSLDFVVHSNPANASAAFESGDVKLLRLRTPQLEQVLAGGETGLAFRREGVSGVVASSPGDELCFLLINWSAEPFSSVPTQDRNAALATLSSSIDRGAIRDAVYPLGTAAPVWGLGALAELGESSAIRDRQEEPLADLRIRFDGRAVLLSDNGPESRLLAARLGPSLQASGLSVSPEFRALGQVVQRWLQKDYAISLAWIEHQIPARHGLEWLALHDQASPFAVLGSARAWMSEGVASARSVVDDADRAQAFRSLFERLDREQISWLPLFRRKAVYVGARDLSGYVIDKNGGIYIGPLRLEDD